MIEYYNKGIETITSTITSVETTITEVEETIVTEKINVDTTTVTPSAGDALIYDAGTAKFEAAAGIDGGYYG